MKRLWEKPKLIIMERGRPEEMVLAGCKIKNKPLTPANKNTGCQQKSRCNPVCSGPGTS